MSRAIYWEPKDPNDIDDFSIDWTPQLKGETLASAIWSLVDASGVVIEASSVETPYAKVRLSGGIENETATLLCRATTSSGRQLDQTAKLGIVTA